jgi:hypothetical protein
MSTNIFTHDIFISYRHLDNAAPAKGEQGWIDDFHKRLEIRLGVELGREPLIWRDPEIQGGEFFADVISERVEKTKVLISVLSPGYIDPTSSWCLKELSEFCRLAEKNIGVRIGDKSRCVKVVKTFLPREEHPTELQGLLGYEFFEEDQRTGRPREFSYAPGGHQHQSYLDKIDDLAWYLRKLLELIEERQPAAPIPTTPPIERTVYLAETTSDRAGDRDKIMRELRDRNYYVLPDKELPETASAYRESVRENLKRARLAIHLIGETYGKILDGEEEKSVVYMQNELAAERSDARDFERIIWMPLGLTPAGERQRRFVNYLKTDGEAQKGAELLERSFEELKNRFIEKLTAPKPSVKLPTPPDDLIYIYLICDKLDFDAVAPVKDYLFDRGYEVILAARDGDETQVLQYHKDNLLECDATLIYYGSANEFWLRSKLWDLKKVAGWGRAKPMFCKAIYLSAPETEHKRRLRTWEAKLLPSGFGGLSEAAIEQFIAEVESAKTERAQTGSGGAR